MLKAMSISAVQPEQRQIESAIRLAAEAFPAEIDRIRYSFGDDWAGDPALFFRVLLRDPSHLYERFRSSGDKSVLSSIGQLLRQISAAVTSNLELEGRQPYFRFRTLEEQKELQDPEWD
jgi:hypothetical protein